MNIPKQLHQLGQNLWLDNIVRDIFNNGALQHYINDYDVTGLTSNPAIFAQAIGRSEAYNGAIRHDYRVVRRTGGSGSSPRTVPGPS